MNALKKNIICGQHAKIVKSNKNSFYHSNSNETKRTQMNIERRIEYVKCYVIYSFFCMDDSIANVCIKNKSKLIQPSFHAKFTAKSNNKIIHVNAFVCDVI